MHLDFVLHFVYIFCMWKQLTKTIAKSIASKHLRIFNILGCLFDSPSRRTHLRKTHPTKTTNPNISISSNLDGFGDHTKYAYIYINIYKCIYGRFLFVPSHQQCYVNAGPYAHGALGPHGAHRAHGAHGATVPKGPMGPYGPMAFT